MMEKSGGKDEGLMQLKPETLFEKEVRIARPSTRQFEL
jgi:hypothetical protein